MVGRRRPATAGSASPLWCFSSLVERKIGVKEGKKPNDDIELMGKRQD
jgi:hypothetical protein